MHQRRSPFPVSTAFSTKNLLFLGLFILVGVGGQVEGAFLTRGCRRRYVPGSDVGRECPTTPPTLDEIANPELWDGKWTGEWRWGFFGGVPHGFWPQAQQVQGVQGV